MKIGLLVSGDGHHLDALLGADIKPALVLADHPCTALNKAQGHRLRREMIQPVNLTQGPAHLDVYTRRVINVLNMYGVELVVMAGFSTELSPVFFERYRGRVIKALGTDANLVERVKEARTQVMIAAQ